MKAKMNVHHIKKSILIQIKLLSIVFVASGSLLCSCHGSETGMVYVANKTKTSFICVLTLDGDDVPVGIAGAGGTSGTAINNIHSYKVAHFHLQEWNDRSKNHDFDVNLTGISGSGPNLHLEIMTDNSGNGRYSEAPK